MARLPTVVMKAPQGGQIRINQRDVPQYQAKGYTLRDASPPPKGKGADPLIGTKQYEDDATKQCAALLQDGYDREAFASVLHSFGGVKSLKDVPAAQRGAVLQALIGGLPSAELAE